MPRPLTLRKPWRHLPANFVRLFKVDSSKKSSYHLGIGGKGLQFYVKTIQINFGLLWSTLIFLQLVLFRLTLVLDRRSSKTKGLRPNACRHFKILCKLVLRPELVVRSSFMQEVKSPTACPVHTASSAVWTHGLSLGMSVWFSLTKTKMVKIEKITNSLTKTKTKTKNDEN